MKIHINKYVYITTGAIIGALLGASAMLLLNISDVNHSIKEAEPMYWVAPMDPNYKRDKPGLSPMGMELIPVYDNHDNNQDGNAAMGLGVVKISPEVINNLGVRAEQVALKTLESDIATIGYIQYDEDQLVHINPRVEGWVEKLYIKAAGMPVQKNDPLYEIYSPSLVNAQEEFVLALNRGNSRLIEAAKLRLKALGVNQSFIDKLTATKKVSQTLIFNASKDGVVKELNIREGFFVKPGVTLMTIGTLDEVWVEAEVFERQSSLVKPGLPVTMTLDYLPKERWYGFVDFVYPTLNAETRTTRVRLRFDNSDGLLKPNMYAQLVIHVDNGGPRLVVPKESVIRAGRQNRVVLALGEGQFKSIEVELGSMDRDYIEILQGLNESDRVVTSAQFLIDSESSISSDFKRMHYSDAPEPGVWVEAIINSIDIDNRQMNVTHQPIKEWQWPVMKMNFDVTERVDMTDLEKGMAIIVKILKNGHDYSIDEIKFSHLGH